MADKLPDTNPMERLLAVMERLRDPDGGCPWDIEQTFETIAPYTIEEAYEVADAIAEGDMDQLRDELGDLLLQVVYHAQIGREQNAFDFNDIATAIAEKMILRHPHVFADVNIADAGQQSIAWEEQKARERAEKTAGSGNSDEPHSALAGIARNLPALTRAHKLQSRAARVGFDWPDAEPVFNKIDEELAEVREEISNGGGREKLAGEVGDVLFAVINMARHLGIEPEDALRKTNRKFERRFKAMEELSKENDEEFSDLSLERQEELWVKVKNSE